MSLKLRSELQNTAELKTRRCFVGRFIDTDSHSGHYVGPVCHESLFQVFNRIIVNVKGYVMYAGFQLLCVYGVHITVNGVIKCVERNIIN